MEEKVNPGIPSGSIPGTPNMPNATAGARVDQTSAQATGVGQQPNSVGSMDAGGRTPALDFMELMRDTASSTVLTQGGEEYLAEIKKSISESGGKNFEVITLQYPPKTTVVKYGNRAIALLLSEAVRRDENVPTAANTRHVFNAVRDMLGDNVVLINTIVVTPEDYKKVRVMAAHLINALKPQVEQKFMEMDIRSLARYPLEITTSPDVYQSFNDKYNPHGVPARADITLTISCTVPRRNNRGDASLFSQAETETKIDIATIGAYTVFSVPPAQQGYSKFLPEIHISEITAAIMTEGMIPLLLSVAAEYLINNDYWKSQFRDFGGQHQPNIGNLLNDPATGHPFRVTTLPQRDEFIYRNCDYPILFLDESEGRARIPGLERYAIDGWYPYLIESFNRFLCATPGSPEYIQMPQDPRDRIRSVYTTYTGSFRSGSEMVDSRWVDFLSVMIHRSSERAVCERLLNHLDPRDLVQLTREFAPGLSLEYVTNAIVIPPAIINPIGDLVAKRVQFINGKLANGVTDMSSFVNMGAGYMHGLRSPLSSSNYASFSSIYANGIPTSGGSLF